MVDTRRYSDWFTKAEQDLRSAKILFEHDGDLWVVAFHCQQAAEKYLKGFILASTGLLLEGHNLYRLCKKVCESDTRFNCLLKDCGYLTNYYIETRHPADEPLKISTEEAEECLRIAGAIGKMVLEEINSDS